jgi:hypothetical protein
VTRIVGWWLSLALAVSAAGCDQLATAVGGKAPCVARFSPERCEAMAERVAGDLGVERTAIGGLTILPDRDPDQTYFGARPIYLEIAMADGSVQAAEINCPGISSSYVPSCMDDPALQATSATTNGYRDTPDDATPLPSIDPGTAAMATEIHVPRLDIPINAVGRMEIQVGVGALPNGILSEAEFGFVDDWPSDLSIVDAMVSLYVRSLEPGGNGFDNYYLHGWRPGVERVEAVLVFDVGRFEPGAVLSVRDVVVR